MQNCSFTGHRSIDPRHAESLPGLLSRAIEYAYSEGCRNFYTGGALGFDTMAAKEILRLRMTHRDMRLIVVIPCRGQEDKWSPSEKNMYEYILGEADEAVYVSEAYDSGCMKRRNHYLASACDILIAYSGRSRSGSAQTVRMAEEQGKDVYNLYRALEPK